MAHGGVHEVASTLNSAWLSLASASSAWLTPAQWLSVALMVGGMLVLVWALKGRGSFAEAFRPPAAEPRRPAEPSAIPDPRSVVRDAEELLQLLAEQADQHAGRLERLIADSDARIKRLESLSAIADARSRIEPKRDPLNQQIYELADEGLAPVEIARRLEQQTGKVELVLALRRR
jgi:hypothetical protein